MLDKIKRVLYTYYVWVEVSVFVALMLIGLSLI